MKEAFISLDLDFVQSPSFIGNMYGSKEYKSRSNYIPILKKWLSIDDLLKKLPERSHGDFVGDNSASIFQLQRLNNLKKFEEKPTYINIDQHHNMYHHGKGDVHHYSLSTFKPFECNIGLFKEELISRFIWVIPDFFDEQDFAGHLTFQQEIAKDENTIKFHFMKDIIIEFEFIRWSDFDVKEYDVKFLSIVRNKNFTNTKTEELDDIRKTISIW